MRSVSTVLALLCATTMWLSAETYDDKLLATDTNSPDELYLLAMWCEENGLHRSKLRHLREAVKIDPDHQAAREAMGFLWHDEKWVHRSRVPGAAQAAQNPKAPQRVVAKRPTGPAPKAADIEWNTDIPEVTDAGMHKWLMVNVASKFNSMDNYAGEMDAGWRTMLMEQHKPHMIGVMAEVMSDSGFKDLYASTMIVTELLKIDGPGDRQMAKDLLPFMVKVSERATDMEELYYFGMTVGGIGDKRVVPRLIQLLEKGGDAELGAKAGLSMITLIPEDGLTAAKAEDWWKRYHSASDAVLYGDLLSDPDPEKRLSACYQLYPSQDERIMPTLIDIMKGDNRMAFNRSVALLERITGNDWGLGNLDLPPQQKMDTIKRLEAWWKEEGNRFVFIEFRGQNITNNNQNVAKIDPAEAWIKNLSSIDRDEARSARDGLLNKGLAAVPLLIDALESDDQIRRSKARDVLREITKQNHGYDAGASEADRANAIKAWRDWLATQDT